MDAPHQYGPNELRAMSPEELVRICTESDEAVPKAIRIEIRSRVEAKQEFDTFLKIASAFREADPRDPPLTNWRREFKKRMVGLGKKLEGPEWGLLLTQHSWYFADDIEEVQALVPAELLKQLCYENPTCFGGYFGAESFIATQADDAEEYFQRKPRERFTNAAVAIDIEFSEGEGLNGFREVCYRSGDQSEVWRVEDDTDLADYFHGLEQAVKKGWLIGHNVLGWDLPRIREFMGDDFLHECPVWDTIVVQTLLEPWLVSQALIGGEQAHQASADVDSTMLLFQHQAASLVMDYEVLMQERSSPEAFVDRLCTALRKHPEVREPPCLPEFASKGRGKAKKILVPYAIIEELHWIPGLRFETALRNPTVITEEITPSGDTPISRIAETIILDLMCYAESESIDLIYSMIPHWIRAMAPHLAGQDQLLDVSETKNAHESTALLVATYESLPMDQIESLDWSEWHEPFAELRQACLLRPLKKTRRPPSLVYRQESLESGRQLRRLDPKDRHAMAPASSEEAELWVDYHPARWRDSLPWQVWDATSCRAVSFGEAADSSLKEGRATFGFRSPGYIKDGAPWHAVSAASQNRHRFWVDLVEIVGAILQRSPEEPIVHILLLEQAAELAVADQLFAELQWAPGYGRSRFQRLVSLRGEESGKCLVGLLRDAMFWQRASERGKIRVEFIVPELPIDRWAVAATCPTSAPATPRDSGANSTKEERKSSEHGIDSQPSMDGSSEQLGDQGSIGEVTDTNDQGPVQMLDPDDEQEGEVAEDSGILRGHEFPQSEAFSRAVQRNLLPWLRMLFPRHQPWLLDQRVVRACRPLLFRAVTLEVQESPSAQSILENYRSQLGAPLREVADHSLQSYRKMLQGIWKFPDFKAGTQLPAIEEISRSEKDIFISLPTGEGKSVLFQIPALIEGMATGRLSIVISPLKALMKDQVANLHDKGFVLTVDYLSSDLDKWSLADAHQRILDGQTQLLYVAPERFRNRNFLEILKRRNLSDGGFGFAILDEAHCFWLWGLEFRPDYFYAVDYLNREYRSSDSLLRFFLFSATVTDSVFSNVREHIGEDPDNLILRPEDRLHPVRDFLELEPRQVPSIQDRTDRLRARSQVIAEEIRDEGLDPDKSIALVFVQMRSQAEECRNFLDDTLDSWTAKAFHAGMETAVRSQVYQELKEGKVQLLTATKAFGLGMDLPNIHRCFHLSPPCFLEDYLQEVGRTGRGDKERGDAGLKRVKCTIIWDKNDLDRNKELVTRSALNLNDLHELHSFACKSCYESSSGERLTILFPREELGSPNDTRLRSALGWLERKPLARIEIVQSLPHMLEIQVNDSFRSTDQHSDSVSGEVRRVVGILGAILRTGKAYTGSIATGSENRFLGEVLESEGGDKSEWRRMVLSVIALFREASLQSLGEAYGILGEFVREGLIKVDRDLEFSRGRQWQDRAGLIEAGQLLITRIGGSSQNKDRSHTHKDLVRFAEEILVEQRQEIAPDSPQDEPELDARPSILARAVLRSARGASIDVGESTDEEGQICFRFNMPSSTIKAKLQTWKNTWKFADRLASHCSDIESGLLSWGTLLAELPSGGGWHRLKSAFGILGNLRVVHMGQSLGATTYLVRIKSDAPLLGDEGKPVDETVKLVDRELTECNEFNRLRELAMELWLRLPDSTNRREFVDEYFGVTDSRSLSTMMVRRIDRLDKSATNAEEFKTLLQHLRQEALDDELRHLIDGEEPNQGRVARAPFRHDILVNAGPGAGKTRVLLTRAAHLIHEQGVRPEEILILAFNRAVVSELRRRICRLFEDMGYGSYVRRVRIHTFHGFAIGSLPEEWKKLRGKAAAKRQSGGDRKDGDLQQLMRRFIDHMLESDGFARRVAGNFRVILVDEFQDMNDDFYGLLLRLKEVSEASLMAIGDDDQDVLRWNRGGADAPSSTEYFRRLKDHIPGLKEITLGVNFRSSAIIVDESQTRLEEQLPAANLRMKREVELSARKRAEPGDLQEFGTWQEGIEIAGLEAERSGSCGVLCRTNAEAFAAYVSLKNEIGGAARVRILGGADIPLHRLRHISEFLWMVKSFPELAGESIETGWKSIRDQFEARPIPERVVDHTLSLEGLRTAFLQQEPQANVQAWCDWLGELQTLEAERILTSIGESGEQQLPGVTVATIHKVKGLEFDSVVVMPSNAAFPFNDEAEHDSLSEVSRRGTAGWDSFIADEARLYYVGLTRAKVRAWIGKGERENSWRKGERFDRVERGLVGSAFLCGSPTEVDLGYSSLKNTAKEMQPLLRRVVRVGDSVRLQQSKSGGLLVRTERGELIARLSTQKSKRLADCWHDLKDVRVAAICRWPVDQENEPRPLSETIVGLGWFYTALIGGA